MTSAARVITARYPALGFPQFRRYWLATFAAIGATQLVTLGQGWLIYELSGSALQLGILGAAASIPNILMTLLGGVIADRFDRRRILLTTSLITATLLAVLTFLDFADAQIPSDMQGRSLRPSLEGPTPQDWRKSMYYHY